MQSDNEFKPVMNEVDYELNFNPAEIGVAVNTGNPLAQYYHDLAKIFTGRGATRRAKRIKAAKEALDLILNNNRKLLDAEIAYNLVELLKLNTSVNHEKIEISVTNGFVSLNGTVEWDFQQEPVINSIGLLKGVKVVSLRMAAFK